MSLWMYRARLVAVTDGDSVRVLLDLGLGVRAEVDLRLIGVSAPEINQSGGRESLAYVTEWMQLLSAECAWPLLVHTQKTSAREPSERRSFTRYLADVYDSPRVGDSVVGAGRHLNADITAFLSGHPEWPRGQ